MTVDDPVTVPADGQRARFEEAIRRIDRENSRDPHMILWQCKGVPYELFYSQRVTEWVLRLAPGASEPLLLAARCQHICRWQIPRNSYPMDRAGYLKWRADLKKFHAEASGRILEEVGYGQEIIQQVQSLNLKQGLGRDPEVQVLEDALCLVTLVHQLGELMLKTPREKMLGILQKTWRKMSPAAREAALAQTYSAAVRELIESALSA